MMKGICLRLSSLNSNGVSAVLYSVLRCCRQTIQSPQAMVSEPIQPARGRWTSLQACWSATPACAVAEHRTVSTSRQRGRRYSRLPGPPSEGPMSAWSEQDFGAASQDWSAHDRPVSVETNRCVLFLLLPSETRVDHRKICRSHFRPVCRCRDFWSGLPALWLLS